MRIAAAALVVLLAPLPTLAKEFQDDFRMCGRDRVTCVVDGDTIWLGGVNLRLETFDTPVPYNDVCGQREVELAHRASARQLEFVEPGAAHS